MSLKIRKGNFFRALLGGEYNAFWAFLSVGVLSGVLIGFVPSLNLSISAPVWLATFLAVLGMFPCFLLGLWRPVRGIGFALGLGIGVFFGFLPGFSVGAAADVGVMFTIASLVATLFGWGIRPFFPFLHKKGEPNASSGNL